MDRKDATSTSADATKTTISLVARAVERAVAMEPSGGRSIEERRERRRLPPTQAPAPPAALIMAAAQGAVNIPPSGVPQGHHAVAVEEHVPPLGLQPAHLLPVPRR